ncbi:MAG: co-chaperone GroES [Armatimonadetes bacterium]|nr:co-chaperone GroES [Armatimonadota bacterium]
MLQPLGDRVIVEPLEGQDKSPGGIILPDTAKERPQEGKVIAVGPGALNDKGERVPLPVKEGDIVIFTEFGGTEIKVDGKKYLIVDERSLLAVKEA